MYNSADVTWTLVAAFLVFFMQAGFALCEAGLTRAKNTGNILMKNMMDFCIGTPCYWLVGFGIMFAGSGALIGGFDRLCRSFVALMLSQSCGLVKRAGTYFAHICRKCCATSRKYRWKIVHPVGACPARSLPFCFEK